MINISELKPTPGYVLIEPEKAEKQTATGFILPDDTERPQVGKVLAVGNEIYQDGLSIFSPARIGDRVVYKKWNGSEFKIDEIEYQFMKFEDILATI